MQPTPEAVRAVLAEAEELVSPAAVQAALDRMAAAISARLADRDPLAPLDEAAATAT